MRETVLYYAPEYVSHVPLLKGVMVSMGIKIKNLTPDRCIQKIGYLAGMEGFEKRDLSDRGRELLEKRCRSAMNREMLVFCGFADGRIDELLTELKKTGVPKIDLKAIVTETNAQWTPYELYEQLKQEHEQVSC